MDVEDEAVMDFGVKTKEESAILGLLAVYRRMTTYIPCLGIGSMV